ncbi:PadR family transcriptional regulator [Sphingomonas alba]|uniref:PadR family transcriptional regulator n=1 Tax=Sphingomonas alba TaxID=2908208 RepID=A0ABT0RPB5_9SPHN|nr:PadR family transcriptional regulator [Sphingomonas alba]MCL6684403.1 PadR family transcriptional regulator [Sphingomonas alba]
MLTELDNCILGVIWRGGPMSAYGVRAHFAGSSTVSWSSSTGTVYPAIRRLRQSGYLDAGSPTGPRKSELLSLTTKGRKALDDWLTKVGAGLGSARADPLRTRVHFLSALDPAARRQAFADYRAATRAAIASVEKKLERPAGDMVARSERLGSLGALAELNARLDWLHLAERELSSEK